MKNVKKVPKLFYRYLLSYIGIFLIPFILTSSFFYQLSVSNLQEEIIQSNMEKIEQVRDFSDSRMKELENIATRISMDPELTPYMMKQPFKSKQAIRELTSYKVNSSIIHDLLLYYRDDPYIYSTLGSSSVSNFTNNMYPFEEQDKRVIIGDLQSITESAVYPVQVGPSQTDKMIAYIFPVRKSQPTAYGTVLFLVNEDSLTETVENVLGEFHGSIFIFNEQQELLTSKSSGDAANQQMIEQTVLGKSGVIETELQHEPYSLVSITSEVTGWTFVTAVPTEQFYAKMSNFKQMIFIILSIILLIGIGLSIYFSRRQFKPMQGIIQVLRGGNGSRAEHADEKLDDLHGIRESIQGIYQDNEVLQRKIHKQHPYVRDQLLMKLLKGRSGHREELKQLKQELPLPFSKQLFAVKLDFQEKVSENQTLLQREKVLNWLANISFHECRGYGVELIAENAVVLIVNIHGKGQKADEKRKVFTKEIIHQLQQAFSITPTVGVGTICDSVDTINRSFIEATAAVEYNLVGIKGSPIYFEHIPSQRKNTFWYAETDYMKLMQSLKQGDKAVATETLSSIFASFKKEQVSIHMLKLMCFDISNIIFKHVTKFDIPHDEKEVEALIEFQSLDELEDKLQELIAKICKKAEQREQTYQQDLTDNILAYIQKSYNSHELSLEFIAKHFQVSVSYLSRFIKEQTGSTFTQYVWKLRNEEFKRQLIQTDESIKNLVLNVGYIDVANFTRKFKQKEGITPGQYRKQYRSENYRML